MDEAQAGRNINNLRYADNTTLMAESEELKILLIKVKEESEKVDLKLSNFYLKYLLSKVTFKLKSWHLVPSVQGKQMGIQWKQ